MKKNKSYKNNKYNKYVMSKELQTITGYSVFPTPKKTTAYIIIGDWRYAVTGKRFTKRQIKHIKDFFGFDVKNVYDEK